MKTRFILIGSILFLGFFLSVNKVSASGGKFFMHEKIEHVVAASYNFMVPVGDFANSGRGGNQFGKIGQGFELEYLYYPDWDFGSDNFRVGGGVSVPFNFLPINSPSLHSKLDGAFNKDAFSNTTYVAPINERWFTWGAGLELSGVYIVNRFSLEATVKVGRMLIYPPGYKITGGGYVPPEYAQYFPREGSTSMHTTTTYVNLGLQFNWFFADYVSVFGGVAYNYMQPTFKKDLLYMDMQNNEPTVNRQQLSITQPMNFVQFRFGIAVQIPE